MSPSNEANSNNAFLQNTSIIMPRLLEKSVFIKYVISFEAWRKTLLIIHCHLITDLIPKKRTAPLLFPSPKPSTPNDYFGRVYSGVSDIARVSV